MAITLHTEVPEDEIPEQTELQAGRYRDDFQREVDAVVGALKIATAKAGWPEPDPKKLFHRYVVDAKDLAGLNAVIRRAGVLHRLEIDFYKPGTTEAGHRVVKFHVSRKLDKDGKPVKDDTLNDDGSPQAVAPKAVAPKPAAPKPAAT